MIKIKLLPMQFLDSVSVPNEYYFNTFDIKLIGPTIDTELPCLPRPGDAILLLNLDLDKIYGEWVQFLKKDGWDGLNPNPIKELIDEVRGFWYGEDQIANEWTDKDILHDLIYGDHESSIFSYDYCVSKTKEAIFMSGVDFVVLPIDNIYYTECPKEESETASYNINIASKKKIVEDNIKKSPEK